MKENLELIKKEIDEFFALADKEELSREEQQTYESNLRYYRDLKNAIDTAREEGRKEGIEKVRELKKEKDC